MTLTLSPEQKKLVQQIAELRGFASPEAFVDDVLGEIIEREVYLYEQRVEMSALIDQGWEEAQRGELLTPADAKQRIADMKRGFSEDRTAAA